MRSSRWFTKCFSDDTVKNFLHPFQAAIKRAREVNRYLPVIETSTLWQGERPLRHTASKPKEKPFHYCTFVLPPSILNLEEGKKKGWIIHEGRRLASAVNSAGVSPLSVAQAFFSPGAVDVGAELQRRCSFDISSGHLFSTSAGTKRSSCNFKAASFIRDRDKALFPSFHPACRNKQFLPSIYH